MYMRPFTTSRMITVRLPPPVLPGGISGSTSPHSSSVRSLGYRNLLRSQRARFLLVHIGDPSSNQATTLESQVIHMIQELFGQTLSIFGLFAVALCSIYDFLQATGRSGWSRRSGQASRCGAGAVRRHPNA